MNLTHLEYFVSAIDHQSFSKASREIFVSPSTISLAVSRLEKELGLNLVERSNVGIQPTEAGKVFYEKASNAILGITNLGSSTRLQLLQQTSLEETITIAIATHSGSPPIITSELILKHAHSIGLHNIGLVHESNATCREALMNDFVNAAILVEDTHVEHLDYLELCKAEIKLLVSKDHLSRITDSETSIRNFLDCPIATPIDCSPLYSKIKSLYSSVSLEPKFRNIENSPSALSSFLDRDNGIMFTIKQKPSSHYFHNSALVTLFEKERFFLPISYVSKYNASVSVKHIGNLLRDE